MAKKRVLHTSDWHLGQTFHGFDRRFEHERFLAWLLQTITAHEIDALFISGDVFDTANPSTAAQRLWFEFLGQLLVLRRSCDVVAIAGNHDSGAGLEKTDALTKSLGHHVLGSVRDAAGEFDPRRLVIPLGARDGAAPWGYAAAIPFLRPDDLGSLSELQQENAFEVLTRKRHEAIFAALRDVSHEGHARFALAHGVVGGETHRSADSERDLRIGNVESMPVDMFPADLTYVALGHLHRPQRAGRRDSVQYAGSPLPLHVSEADYAHRVVVVTVQGSAVLSQESILVPKVVAVVRVPEGKRAATPDEALLALRALRDMSAVPAEERPYLEVRYRLESPRPAFPQEVADAIEGKGYRLTVVRAERETELARTQDFAAEDASLLSFTPEEVFREFYQRKYPTSVPSEALLQAFGALVDGVLTEQVPS